MKTTEMPVSQALRDVREAKRRVYEETKDMTTEERMAYFRRASEDLARAVGKRWVKNPDGTSSLV
jgi:hypothetical protein